MKENLQELMMTFGVTLGKRNNMKQKDEFIAAVSNYFCNLGYKSDIHTSDKMPGVRNIIMGNAEKADTVFVTSYDTPLKATLPSIKYFPLHLDKNLREERKNIFLNIIICIAICVAVYMATCVFISLSGVRRIVPALIIAAFLAIVFMLFKKRANTYNFTRNSASIALMCHIAYENKNSDKAAFVFLDKNVSSNEGWKLFDERLSSCRGVIIAFDCIAEGENIAAAYRCDRNKAVDMCIQKLRASDIGDKIIAKPYDESKISQNALAYYRNMIILSAGSIYKKEFTVSNTCSNKDIKWDADMLLKLSVIMVSL